LFRLFATLLSLRDGVRVDPEDPFVLASGVIPYPYEVNAPLWSDGAGKVRGLAIPNGTTIGIEPDGDLDLPIGSVLVKHFLLAGEPIETRLFLRSGEEQWDGYSYEWNGAGTDAVLLDEGMVVNIDGLDWLYPDPDECTLCHTEAAGASLGPELDQLDGDFDYGASHFDLIEGVANQIDALEALRALDRSPPDNVPALSELLSGDALEDRARA
jgi:hypothetical protein